MYYEQITEIGAIILINSAILKPIIKPYVYK